MALLNENTLATADFVKIAIWNLTDFSLKTYFNSLKSNKLQLISIDNSNLMIANDYSSIKILNYTQGTIIKDFIYANQPINTLTYST